MSVEMVIALCTGIVSIIGAFGAMLLSLRNGQAIKADAEAKDQKLQEIHVLVNSRLSDTLKEIAELRTYVAEMTQNDVDVLKAEKAKIDVKVLAASMPSSPSVPSVPSVPVVLPS